MGNYETVVCEDCSQGTVVWLIGFRIGLGVCLLKMVIVVSIVCRSVVQGVAGLVLW